MAGYGKVFQQIYDSTVAENWKGLVTFQQFIVLADKNGVVDMTQESISRRTNIPIDIIREGISYLEKTDSSSRSQSSDGRRIERLDAHRDWGWRLVNAAHYRKLMSREEKLIWDREQLRRKRAEAENSKEINNVANVANVADVEYSASASASASKEEKSPPAQHISSDEDFWRSLPNNPAYSFINLVAERGKMAAWLALPQNKNRKMTRRFVLNWLNRIEKPLKGEAKSATAPVHDRVEL